MNKTAAGTNTMIETSMFMLAVKPKNNATIKHTAICNTAILKYKATCRFSLFAFKIL
jgi:hypothetical protein